MTRLRSLAALSFLLVLPACYHAVIDTGRPASATVVTKSFQPSFIYGLVPPPALNVSQQCPAGVAKVETMHTFVEGLVGAITWGLFTPMSYKVTCASGGSSALPASSVIHVAAGATNADQLAAVAAAMELARSSGAPAYVKF